MNRTLKFAGAAAVVLAALALATAYFYIPGGIRPSFEEGEIHVLLDSGGTMEFTWPEARLEGPAEHPETPEEAAELPPPANLSYRLEVGSGGQRLTFTSAVPSTACAALELPLELRIQAAVEGKNLLGLTRTLTSRTLTVTVDQPAPSAPEAVGSPGPGSLSLSWKQTGRLPELYEIFTLEDGVFRHTASTQERQADLSVRKNGGDLVLPGYDRPLEVHVRAGVRGEGYILCGPASNLIRVERQDLLGDDLNLTYQETEPRVFTLEWDETRGEYYELQEWNEEGWTLLETLDPAESFAYDLGRLGSGSHHRFQVVAKDGNGTVRSSEEAEFFASADPLYATVWPIIEQSFYEQADKDSASLGKIPGGTALCVLEESGDWFQVRYKDQYGWGDSRFCMINLPEYVGDHCAYDITNSYRSVFKVHENPIALITDQVIQGFEHIQTEDGQFLVPYLYPSSKKLLSAAQAAEADGFRLKIYEAFRPNEATRFLYDTTAAQLDWAALVYSDEDAEGQPLAGNEDPRVLDPVTGWEVDLADGLLLDPETEEKISREDLAQRQAEELPPSEDGLTPGEVVPEAPEDILDPSQPFFTLPEEGEGSLASETPPEPQPDAQPEPQPEPQTEPAPQPEPEPQTETPPETQPDPQEETQEADPEGEEAPDYETYFQIMTNNGRFSLGSFLAKVTSAHNRGIALDLTLEETGGGELEMQSAIHDLSWYSAAYLNNDNAKRLETYMTGSGMRGLSSEWWHFQDDETREAIGLTSYLFKGVDLKGWTRDGRGWRYRNEDGSVLRDTVFTVDGKRYTADRDGYVPDVP